MPSETMPPPGKVSDALFPVRLPAPKAVKHRTPIKRTAPPRRRNYARHKREWLRSYGSIERVSWIASLPCIVPSCAQRPSQNAHIESGGKGRKADSAKVVALCIVHHSALHGWGRESFERIYKVDLTTSAADTERRWQEEAA